jgi:hypothetical protein
LDNRAAVPYKRYPINHLVQFHFSRSLPLNQHPAIESRLFCVQMDELTCADFSEGSFCRFIEGLFHKEVYPAPQELRDCQGSVGHKNILPIKGVRISKDEVCLLLPKKNEKPHFP